MAQEATFTMPAGLVELRDLLEAGWPARREALRTSGVPLMEGGDDEDGAAGGESDDDGDGADGGEDETESFDAAYVKKLRAENAKWRREAQEARSRAQEYEDQNKTEAQKLEERAAQAEERAKKSDLDLARLRVALRKGLTETQAKRLIGDTEEDLEADADELLASFKTDDDRPGGDTSRRPRERLRPGATPSSDPDEETDPRKLAELIPRM